MKELNPYESLRLDRLPEMDEGGRVVPENQWIITTEPDERINIYTNQMPDGTWVWGYYVDWANGRVSMRQPDDHIGRFASQREARLYGIGYMRAFIGYFRPETQEAILAAEKTLLQQSFEF